MRNFTFETFHDIVSIGVLCHNLEIICGQEVNFLHIKKGKIKAICKGDKSI